MTTFQHIYTIEKRVTCSFNVYQTKIVNRIQRFQWVLLKIRSVTEAKKNTNLLPKPSPTWRSHTVDHDKRSTCLNRVKPGPVRRMHLGGVGHRTHIRENHDLSLVGKQSENGPDPSVKKKRFEMRCGISP